MVGLLRWTGATQTAQQEGRTRLGADCTEAGRPKALAQPSGGGGGRGFGAGETWGAASVETWSCCV